MPGLYRRQGLSRASIRAPCHGSESLPDAILAALAATQATSPTLDLAQRLVQDDRHCIGEVEAAYPPGRHWDAQRSLAVALQDGRGQSARLAAKEQAVARVVADTRVGRLGMSAKAEHATGRKSRLEFRQRCVAEHLHLVEVIHGRTPYRPLADGEAESAD